MSAVSFTIGGSVPGPWGVYEEVAAARLDSGHRLLSVVMRSQTRSWVLRGQGGDRLLCTLRPPVGAFAFLRVLAAPVYHACLILLPYHVLDFVNGGRFGGLLLNH